MPDVAWMERSEIHDLAEREILWVASVVSHTNARL
jgi:hypothetical protein